MKRTLAGWAARLRRRAVFVLPIALTLSAGALAAKDAWTAEPRTKGDAATLSPAGATSARSTSPLRGMAPPSEAAPTEGRVVEHLDAGPYVYLRIARPDGGADAWVATLGDGEPVGTRVSVRSLGSRTNFPSRRLDRVFPRLDFAMVTTLEDEVIR